MTGICSGPAALHWQLAVWDVRWREGCASGETDWQGPNWGHLVTGGLLFTNGGCRQMQTVSSEVIFNLPLLAHWKFRLWLTGTLRTAELLSKQRMRQLLEKQDWLMWRVAWTLTCTLVRMRGKIHSIKVLMVCCLSDQGRSILWRWFEWQEPEASGSGFG